MTLCHYVRTTLDDVNMLYRSILDRHVYNKTHPRSFQRSRQLPNRHQYRKDVVWVHVLCARLLGSIFQTIRYLGPPCCAFSIVEGRLKDGTFEALVLLRRQLDRLGVRYFLQLKKRNPQRVGGGATGDRIQALAILRNRTLQPLVDLRLGDDADVTIVFVNDVAICMGGIVACLGTINICKLELHRFRRIISHHVHRHSRCLLTAADPENIISCTFLDLSNLV